VSAILFKIATAVVAALIGAYLLRSSPLQSLPNAVFLRRVVAVQVALALVPFLAIYVIAGQHVPSDVRMYYVPAAHAVLNGELPFRDFSLSYAPLFAYLGASLMKIWDDGRVFPAFAILVNVLALVLWQLAAGACFGQRVARRSSILYATSGHVVIQTLLGSSQVWIGAALGGSALLIGLGRSASSGLVQSIALSTTKLLVPLFWPVLWMCAPKRLRWLAGALLLSAAIYGLFALRGADLLDPVHREAGLTSSGNLPYLLFEPLSSALGRPGRYVSDGLLLVTLAAMTAWLYAQARRLPPQARSRLLVLGIAATGLTFMLFSKKSNTAYAVFFMYPTILVLVTYLKETRALVGFLLAFNVLLVAEAPLWWLLSANDLPLATWLHQEKNHAVASGFILIDLMLIACYVYLARLSIRCVREEMAHAEPGRSPLTARGIAQ
jgi:hypothetical protein